MMLNQGRPVAATMIWRALVMLALIAALWLPAAGAASAQDDGGGTDGEGQEEAEAPAQIIVRVFSGSGPDREGVEDVAITVEGPSGAVLEARTDAEGVAQVAADRPGDYVVTIDPNSLPEGVEYDDETSRPVSVVLGQEKFTNFGVGERGDGETTSTVAQLGSLAVSGLRLGAIIALASIGLSLIFGITGLVNFAHGELVTLGAVVAYFFNAAVNGPQWHLLLAAVPAVIVGGGFGWAQDRVLWRPLRRRKASNVSMLVVVIGLMFAVQYAVLWIFDGAPRPYTQFVAQSPMPAFQPINVEPKVPWLVGVAIVVLTGVGLMLMKTRLGTAMRAIADNADLARASGINVERVVTITWMMAGGLAALGGVLYGVSEQVHWQMGFKLLLAIFAAVVLGGLGTAFGAMLGGFAIGMVVEVSTYVIPTELKFATGLVALIIMLMLRPQGLLGVKERVG